MLKIRQSSFIPTNRVGKKIEMCINISRLNTPLSHVVTKSKGVWSAQVNIQVNIQFRDIHWSSHKFVIYPNIIEPTLLHKYPILLTILLASIVSSWPHFLFFLVFTLNSSKHDCNGGEEEDEPCFAIRIIHVFVDAYEACRGHSSIVLQGEWEKIVISSLVYGNIWHRERNIWS